MSRFVDISFGDCLNFNAVINFNYDAFWLRSLFQSMPIVTIVNDDFESLCRFPIHSHLTWALRRTCAISNKVFAVSIPLHKRLSRWCKPELFLPWASEPYKPPKSSSCRNVLLYWGYINDRLDISFLLQCLPLLGQLGLRMRFVGPVEGCGHQLSQYANESSLIDYQPACSFTNLDTSDCIAAMLPYRLDYLANLACQLPNKALQLLSRGLPLISTKLPYLHQAPFIILYDNNSSSSFIQACKTAIEQYMSMQYLIEKFLGENGSQSRLNQILEGLE